MPGGPTWASIRSSCPIDTAPGRPRAGFAHKAPRATVARGPRGPRSLDVLRRYFLVVSVVLGVVAVVAAGLTYLPSGAM